MTHNEAPSLDHLDYETRVLIALLDATGVRTASGHLWWRSDDPTAAWNDEAPLQAWRLVYHGVLCDDGTFVYTAPSPLSDPAAWGALMEKELARWERGEFDGEWQHRFWYPSGDDVTLTPGPWRESIGEAASLAVCAKYGKAITLYHGG